MKQKNNSNQFNNKNKQGLSPSPLFKELIRMLAKSVAQQLKRTQE